MSDNKVALVTGASRGIGQAIAHALAADGFYVVGTATSQGGADKIAQSLKEGGFEGEGFALNVTDPESIEALMAHLKASCGMPYALVNNAGITKDNLLMRMSEDEWDQVLETNLKGVFRLTKAVVRPMMKAREGRVVNVGSVVGTAGNAGQANYCAAKAGLVGFSKSAARELASRGITVNVVAPGFVDTDMTDVLGGEMKDALLNQIPLGRIGRPEEIAAAVRFLCSASAAYITGETIHVNGGMSMV